MQLAANQILGEHDFTSFSKKNKSKVNETFVRTVHRAQWRRVGDTLQLEITATAFTRQMVRSLVGMFVEIGRGRRQPDEMGEALRAMSRMAVSSPAPPQGLELTRAHYRSDA
jgi:tRNA pseudouridine38-40 synthase